MRLSCYNVETNLEIRRQEQIKTKRLLESASSAPSEVPWRESTVNLLFQNYETRTVNLVARDISESQR